MLDPFLHIDVAPVEHNSQIPHPKVKAKALQLSLGASDLQLFDLTTTPVPHCLGNSSMGGIWRSWVRFNVTWSEHGGAWWGHGAVELLHWNAGQHPTDSPQWALTHTSEEPWLYPLQPSPTQLCSVSSPGSSISELGDASWQNERDGQ